MDYGLSKATEGGTLANTGLSTGQQIAVCLSALILIGCVAYLIRKGWRRGKKLGDR